MERTIMMRPLFIVSNNTAKMSKLPPSSQGYLHLTLDMLQLRAPRPIADEYFSVLWDETFFFSSSIDAQMADENLTILLEDVQILRFPRDQLP